MCTIFSSCLRTITYGPLNVWLKHASFFSGLKDTLFDEYLLEDAVYLGVAGGLIVLAILAYTQSFFLTLTTTLSIVFSLSLAYFLYSIIFGIDFFPFMNILAAVIAIGKIWMLCFSRNHIHVWIVLKVWAPMTLSFWSSLGPCKNQTQTCRSMTRWKNWCSTRCNIRPSRCWWHP